jgi:diguanylate cyclase (GGDEF)-like protein
MVSPLRVLIAEDSEDDTLLLVRELRRGGFDPAVLRVDTRNDLSEALQNDHWDVVITDHNMPGFSSEAALKVVQQTNLDIPVIIVSGSIGEDIAVAAMKMGAHDYIMKDNLTRLVPAIEREMREAEVRRSHRVAEATIRRLAYYDHLTGLVNRNEFDRHLNMALESAAQGEVEHVLLYLDLDQFKVINDTCGHQAGDELLSQLAVVLRDKIRSHDILARLGGDEFGLLLQCCPTEQAKHIAESIREAVSCFRFVWRENSFSIGVSIGMAAISAHARDANEVLSAADIACYTAKELGRDRIHIYMDDDTELLRRHNEMQWVAKIKDALDEDRFVLHRQRMMSLDSKCQAEQCYYEFLVRMKGADGDLILPGAFIPAAERYGVMARLDRWVVKAVIEILAEEYHEGAGENDPGLCFINLSGASLNDDMLFSFIRQQITHHRLPPELLCFEITETAAISNLQYAVEFIKNVRKLGCQFALDDFGAGLSSFSYLRALPVDYLKIDGAFVRDILNDPMNYAIVQAVNQIGHVAGLRTIAESVETDTVLKAVRDIGVDLAQGYEISMPEPAVKAKTKCLV